MARFFGSGPLPVFFKEGAYIRVDEKGTEAASVVVGGGGGFGGPRRREVVIDRPFVFAIVKLTYPLPIFIGTVNDPQTPAEAGQGR